MPAISIARAYSPVEIDLWGAKFETVDVARSGMKKTQKLEEEIEALETSEDTTDEILDTLVAKIGALLDVKLVAADGGKTKPSTLVAKKWKADELTLSQVAGFTDAMRRAEGEANRPS